MSKSFDEKITMMTTKNVEPLILKMAVPTVISMIVTALYNMADTYFVGHSSADPVKATNATAAVGVAFAIMTVIQAVGFFFGQGSGNYISRSMGARNIKEGEKMAATGAVSCFVSGLVLMAIGIIFITPLCNALGSYSEIAKDTETYVAIILMGAPFMMTSMVLNNQLRFQGSATYSMVGLCSGAVLNVGLDYLLIMVFNMGVMGAAIATSFSQVVGCTILFIGTCQKSNISIKLKNFTFRKHYYVEIVRCGLPSLCRQGLNCVATICLTFVARPYGSPAVAGMSVVNRVIMFAFSVLIGIGQGFQPVCGFNYGAGQYSRVLKAFYFVLKVSVCVLLTFAVLGFVFPDYVISFFRDDPKVIEVGRVALRFNCISLPFLTLVMNGSMLLQNLGKATKATVLGSARGGLIFIPTVFILEALFGVLGVEMAQMVADLASFVIAVPFVISVVNELKRTRDLPLITEKK